MFTDKFEGETNSFYGDTQYDSSSVEYGKKEAYEEVLKLVEKAYKQTDGTESVSWYYALKFYLEDKLGI
jgi:hypothetical protein